MSRRDLPAEFEGPLRGFDDLVRTLHLLEGERVHVGLGVSSAPFPHWAVTICGVLSGRPPDWPGAPAGIVFSVGAPPETGGYLALHQDRFESAKLCTFDGNAFFDVTVKLDTLELLIQDARE